MIGCELKSLQLPWAACIALPLPFALFWHSPLGRSYGLMAFLVTSMYVVAQSFGRDVESRSGQRVPVSSATARDIWRMRMRTLWTALLAASVVFSLACILVNNPYNYGTPQGVADQGIWWRAFVFETPRDFVAPILALLAVVAAISIVPYLTLTTRSPIAAVVFSAALVGCMKFAGAIVVVLVYGWDAAEQGRTTMPWNDPDLLVWLFFALGAVLCTTCNVLGKKRFIGELSGRFHSSICTSPPAMNGGFLSGN
jgi:hypothetical protein